MQASLITFLKWHVKHTHVVEIIQPKLRQSPTSLLRAAPRFGESTAAFEPNLHRAATIEWLPKSGTVEQRPVPSEADLSSPN
jgi:hypothetical protein